MMNARDSRYRMGGPMDDVAENIRNERRAPDPDPNPTMPCHGCGDKFGWKDYWKPRVVEMDDPHEEEWLCDDCLETRRKEQNNHGLETYVGTDHKDSIDGGANGS